MSLSYIRTSPRSYIFRWHNFLEFVQRELLLPLAHVLPEDLLQPGDVLLVQNSSLPARERERREVDRFILTVGWLSQ